MATSKVVCFNCRMAFNRQHQKCPNCRDELHNIGHYFKAPKSSKLKEWEAIKLLYEAGFRYISTRSRNADDYDLEWINQYKENVSGMGTYELLNILAKALSQLRELHWNGLPGDRPKHPRDVPSYLNEINLREQALSSEIRKLCEKLGLYRAECKCALNLVIEIQSQARRNKNKLTIN